MRSNVEHTSEAGFSVIEAMVALGIAGVIIVLLSAGLASGLNAALSAKVLQQATALGDEAVEHARSLPFDQLLMNSADLTACPPPEIDPCTGGDYHRFDPDNDGPLADEPIAETSDPQLAGLSPRKESRTVGATTYTLYRYVTWVDANVQGSSQRDHKRVMAIVTWPEDDKVLSYSASTFVADVDRGVQVSKYELDPPTDLETVNSTDLPMTVSRSLAVQNHDIPTSFEFDIDPGTVPTDWIDGLYADSDGDGMYGGGDLVLKDTDTDGYVDTGGTVPTAGTFLFFVVIDVPDTATPGDYVLRVKAGEDGTTWPTLSEVTIRIQ